MVATAAFFFPDKSVATPAISFLTNKAFSYLKECFKADGMEVVKVRLLVRMPEIQAMFNAIDHQQIKEQNVALDAWLWRFRSVVEEQRTPSMSWSTAMEGEARPQGLQDKVGHDSCGTNPPFCQDTGSHPVPWLLLKSLVNMRRRKRL
jgi:hypothetical protein